MNVYTMTHVRRTPVRRTCTAYMYHSVNTLLIVCEAENDTIDDRCQAPSQTCGKGTVNGSESDPEKTLVTCRLVLYADCGKK